MRQTEETNTKTIEAECKRREIKYHRVF